MLFLNYLSRILSKQANKHEPPESSTNQSIQIKFSRNINASPFRNPHQDFKIDNREKNIYISRKFFINITRNQIFKPKFCSGKFMDGPATTPVDPRTFNSNLSRILHHPINTIPCNINPPSPP
ncbi:hypothetical protein CEXT_686611 [Caerostris extrusa]|uniref:Uncharacterized protein n=1 Tax=Caerostris extrusa TaxID=172846 RepID=A0AAV4TZV1_CAEEX|nr:hypothetical protein CEXT_686611 [Caerostris extrusa]